MRVPHLVIDRDYVIIEGARMNRWPNWAPSQWLLFWERLLQQDRMNPDR